MAILLRRGTHRIHLESRVFGPIFALVGFAAAVVGVIIVILALSDGTPIVGGVIASVSGAFLLLVGVRSTLGVRRLQIDVAGNALHYIDHGTVTTIALDDIGAFSITRYRTPVGNMWFKLETPRLPGILLGNTYKRAELEHLQRTLETLSAQAALRAVLATSSLGEEGAFRASPDLTDRLAKLVPDEALRTEALAALARDADPEIRLRARQLRIPEIGSS